MVQVTLALLGFLGEDVARFLVFLVRMWLW